MNGVDRGIQAKSDMIDTLNWLNNMSEEKQQSLTDLASGAVSMTKGTVVALTTSTANQCV